MATRIAKHRVRRIISERLSLQAVVDQKSVMIREPEKKKEMEKCGPGSKLSPWS
jgi:hypothetical protein